jgi:hypothetical protein
MPFLFWLPLILMSGIWNVAHENAGPPSNEIADAP